MTCLFFFRQILRAMSTMLSTISWWPSILTGLTTWLNASNKSWAPLQHPTSPRIQFRTLRRGNKAKFRSVSKVRFQSWTSTWCTMRLTSWSREGIQAARGPRMSFRPPPSLATHERLPQLRQQMIVWQNQWRGMSKQLKEVLTFGITRVYWQSRNSFSNS